MADDFSDSVSLGEVAIVGGGCYGTFYAGQLIRARERGKVSYRRLLVVDRDPHCRFEREIGSADDSSLVVSEWTAFFDEWLEPRQGEPDDRTGDTIVPSPLMPHLMYEWLVRRARRRWPGRSVVQRPLDAPIGTPYDVAAPDGTRYVSYADWLCPTHCIEPSVCPVTRAPRTWEMSEALRHLTARLARSAATRGPALFVCRHRVYGVGMFDVDAVQAGDRLVAEAGEVEGAVDVVVGTVSGCHGAASLLQLGPRSGPGERAGTQVRSIFGQPNAVGMGGTA